MAGWPTPRCGESLHVNTNAAARSAVKPVETRGQWAEAGRGGFPQTLALPQMTEGGRCGVQDWDQL